MLSSFFRHTLSLAGISPAALDGLEYEVAERYLTQYADGYAVKESLALEKSVYEAVLQLEAPDAYLKRRQEDLSRFQSLMSQDALLKARFNCNPFTTLVPSNLVIPQFFSSDNFYELGGEAVYYAVKCSLTNPAGYDVRLLSGWDTLIVDLSEHASDFDAATLLDAVSEGNDLEEMKTAITKFLSNNCVYYDALTVR